MLLGCDVMENVIIIMLLIGIVAGAACYLYRAKKRGEMCVGCSCCKQCSGKCPGADMAKK